VKKIASLTLFLLPLVLPAQKKVDLDRYNFTVQVRSLPQMRLDSSYRTYDVEVEATKLMHPYFQDMSPERTVELDGWRKISKNGHITIHVKLEDLLPEAVAVRERAETVKDRTGRVTGNRIFYYQEVTYTFAAVATITDYKGMHIMDQVLADRGHKQVYRSPEFAISKLAEGYFLVNALAVTRDLYRNCVTNAMHYLSERLTDNFGFGEITINDFMWIVDSRKHPEYAAHRKAFQQMNEVLFTMNANQSIDGARQQLKPVIDYFEKVKKNYPTTSKHDRKIRYASYFNLAVLYYYLDDPQSMMREANGLELNDFDANDSKGFKQSALRLKNLFEQTNIYSRHFPIDASKFKGPMEANSDTVK
jgi:hypothetical protein